MKLTWPFQRPTALDKARFLAEQVEHRREEQQRLDDALARMSRELDVLRAQTRTLMGER